MSDARHGCCENAKYTSVACIREKNHTKLSVVNMLRKQMTMYLK